MFHMSDEEFITAFEDCTLDKQFFDHLGHLRAVWVYLTRMRFEDAAIEFKNRLKAYAKSVKAEEIYSETKTMAWIYLIHHEIRQYPKAKKFKEFYKHTQNDLQKDILLRFYSEDVLNSDKAKQKWIKPDIYAPKEIFPENI